LDLLDGMASMVDKSLVRQIEQQDEEPRFAMLETIREYGLEKLVASKEESPTRRAHAAYCLVLAEEGAAETADGRVKGWLDRFETEHDNFRVAVEWLTETHNAEWGLRLCTALFHFWEMREYLTEGRERLGKLLRLEQAAVPNNARMRALFCRRSSGCRPEGLRWLRQIVSGESGDRLPFGRQAEHGGFVERTGRDCPRQR
jgi:hypothetical protein